MSNDLEKRLEEISCRIQDLEYQMLKKFGNIESRLAYLEENSIYIDDVQRLTHDVFRDYTSYMDSICIELEDELKKFKKGFHPVVIVGGKKDESNIS